MGRIELFTVAVTAVLLVTLGASPSVRADFNDGVAAYEAGDYKTAFNEWLPLARNNDPAAMRNIGHMYRRGLGTAQDYTKAMTWYKRAATIGFDRAQANVAGMYLEGEGVEQDYAQAANWFARAAQQGHVISQYNLALLLENGLGVEKNEQRALGWYALAAKAGHPASQKKAAELAAYLQNKPDEPEKEGAGGPLIKSAETEPPKAIETATASPTSAVDTPETLQTPQAPDSVTTKDETPAPTAATGTATATATATAASSSQGVQKKGFYEALRSLVAKQEVGESSVAISSESQGGTPPESQAETISSTPVTEAASDSVTPEVKPTAVETAPAQPPAASVPAPTPAVKPEVAAVPIKPVEIAAIPAPAGATLAPAPKSAPSVQAKPSGTGLSVAEKLEMADLAYTLEQYQQSLSIWARLAADGNPEAQYRLGSLFNAGVALPVDRVRAYYWWDKARANGSSEAAAALADLEPTLTHLEKRQIDRVN